jgi:hypothetical protein
MTTSFFLISLKKAVFPVFVIIMGLLFFMGGGTGLTWASTRYQEPLSKEALIDLTNNARANEGLTELEENPLLDTIAEARARDILDKQYFAHVSPTGEQASHIALKVGYRYKVIAENLANGTFSTNSKIIDCWMQSPGHRKNILSSQMREIGVSVVKGRLNGMETCVSVQIFGLRSGPASVGTYTFSRRESNVEMGTEGLSGEGLNEKLRRMKQEVDVEQASIQRDIRISSNDPRRYQEQLNLRIRVHNENVNRYNQAVAEAQSMRLAMNSRNQ